MYRVDSFNAIRTEEGEEEGEEEDGEKEGEEGKRLHHVSKWR